MRGGTSRGPFFAGADLPADVALRDAVLLAVMGSSLQPRHVPLPAERKAVEVLRRLADTGKAKRLLGFEAEVPLEEGLARLVRWLDVNIESVH